MEKGVVWDKVLMDLGPGLLIEVLTKNIFLGRERVGKKRFDQINFSIEKQLQKEDKLVSLLPKCTT